MRQVADDTYALGSRGHNFYVIVEDDRATIIDAGCSREWSKLTAGLDSLGISIAAVAGILATHAHADHFGFAKKAQSVGLGIAVHAEEESRALGTYTGRFAATASELPLFNVSALRNFLPLVFAGVMSLEHVEQVGIFTDGDRLDLPGNLTAVHTPGHTEGHTMFHSAERGVLFTGDGLVTMNLLGPGGGPQMMNPVFSLDHEQALASLDRIVALEADLLLPGHGRPWAGSPADAVTLTRA